MDETTYEDQLDPELLALLEEVRDGRYGTGGRRSATSKHWRVRYRMTTRGRTRRSPSSRKSRRAVGTTAA